MTFPLHPSSGAVAISSKVGIPQIRRSHTCFEHRKVKEGMGMAARLVEVQTTLFSFPASEAAMVTDEARRGEARSVFETWRERHSEIRSGRMVGSL